MTVIYLDILLTINLAVDYLLLFAAARLSGTRFQRLHGLAGATVGALYSFSLFLSWPTAVLVITRLFVSCLMLFLTFGRRSAEEFLRLLVLFYVGSFLFSGFLTLLHSIIHVDSFLAENGVVYFEFSALGIVGSSVGAFLVTELLRRLFRHGEPDGNSMIWVFYQGKKTVLKGFTDTGNSLTEPFSGGPVAVCRKDSLKKILPENLLMSTENAELSTRMRMKLVPCQTVSGSVLIPAFRPEKVILEKKGIQWEADDLWIGLSDYAPEGALLMGKNIVFRKTNQLISEVLE